MLSLRHLAHGFAFVSLASFALAGCSDGPNQFSTETYAESELAFEVRAQADDGDNLSVAAEVRGARMGNSTLKADGDDDLVAMMGNGEKPMTWMGGFYSATVEDEHDADLRLVFVRHGARHAIPVALVRKFRVVTRFSAVDHALHVDLDPRPALGQGTSARVTLESCFASSPGVAVESFPIAIDLSKHERIEHVRANPGIDHDCKVGVTVEAHNVRPVGGVDAVTTNARRTATAAYTLR